MLRPLADIIVLLILAEIAVAFVFNETRLQDGDIQDNALKPVETRRQIKKKAESTSSDGSRKTGHGGGGSAADKDESLGLIFTSSSSKSESGGKRKTKKKDRAPKSSADRKGWRKWHRKCTRCPQDMGKKWRDPSIKWICGAYQRARRTFKSLCMMHYRNCQDGTMFTKIADHRCPNGTGDVRPYNVHFFYDYNVMLTEEDSVSGTVETVEEDAISSSMDSKMLATLPERLL